MNLLRTQIVDQANDDYFWWNMENRQTRYPVGGIVRDQLAGNYLWNQTQNSYDNTRDHFINSATLSFDLYKGLKLEVLGGFDLIMQENETKEKIRRPLSVAEGGRYSLKNSKDAFYNGQAILSYDTRLSSDFSLFAYAGGTIQHYSSEWTSRTTPNSGFISRDFFSFKNVKTTPVLSDGYRAYSQLYGAFGSVQFGFRDYLYLEFQGRNDWSSILPSNNNSYFYPGVSASRIFTETFKMPSWMSFGKFRASFADLGKPGPIYFSNQVYDQGNYGSAITYSPAPPVRPQISNLSADANWNWVSKPVSSTTDWAWK